MPSLVEIVLPGLFSQPIQLLEVVVALLLVVTLRWRPDWLRPLGALWRRVESRPAISLMGLALVLVVAHFAMEWNQPRRGPRLHDEFSYLLSAETFLEGRLTNPTPAEWHALDTYHVNFSPTYNSMYPPGHPAVLALSWRWLGHPIYANWILAPVLGLAMWWMLAAWIPRRWALLGGALVALRLGLFGYWAESYMTGALPAICAAIFGGALPRAVRRPSAGLAATAGLSLGVMFSCRPFEAVVLAGGAIPMLWLLRPKSGFRPLLVPAAPGLAIFLLVVGAVAYHNVTLTGSAFRFGYNVNMERHGYGVFPWSSTIGTETEITPRQATFYERTRSSAAFAWTPGGFLLSRIRNVGSAWVFLIGPLLSLGLFHWRRSLGVRRLRPALPGLLTFGIVVALNPWPFPHYYSGAFGFMLVFAVTGIRAWCVRHRVSASLAAGSLLVAASVVLAVRAVAGAAVSPPLAVPVPWLPYNTPLGFEARQTLAREVAGAAPALIFVRHSAADSSPENWVEDWVYNDPSPVRSPVVWANDRGPESNARTARAYPGRRWFCVEIEGGHPRRSDCAPWIARASAADPTGLSRP